MALFNTPAWLLTAAVVVVAFGILFIVFAGLAFSRPAAARRFLLRFASSARTHYTEQACRLLVGAALVVRSAAMWQPGLFWLVGWAIFLSSAVLICLPWQWHRRLGQHMLPVVIRRLRLYALGACAFGVLLLCGVIAGGQAA